MQISMIVLMNVFALLSLVVPSSLGYYGGHQVARSFSRSSAQFAGPPRTYPYSRNYYENYIRRLNSKNFTIQDAAILGISPGAMDFLQSVNETLERNANATGIQPRGLRIIIGRGGIRTISDNFDIENALENMFGKGEDEDEEEEVDQGGGGEEDPNSQLIRQLFRPTLANSGSDDDNYEAFKRKRSRKSENFEVISDFPIRFSDVGGYDNVKAELAQCVDILSNFTKYTKFNVRIPKGLIFEGPPGNGKTLMAKALAGEAGIPFISVSGAQFQEKYVGVGSSRIRELFDLAKKHAPVIIFIDEIDALGRQRSSDGEQSGAERDNTLNELLVSMDGFKNSSGIFIIGATNRADLLDPALLRPGRIDKRIFIGNPDAKTREAILRIHIRGKPYEAKISLADLVDMTSGLSGAQIENLVNEAMLNALRYNREMITNVDIDLVMNKMMVGWQPTAHQFTSDIIDHIAIHEMGHAILGLLSKHHSKMTKVVINLSAPKSPAYTVFENSEEPIHTREALFEHLMILLGGRIAEEVFYNVSVTTGAINDFEEALKLAERMVLYYGMGKTLILPKTSEKYRTIIDDEVSALIQDAYCAAEQIVRSGKDFVCEAAELLKRDNVVQADVLCKMIRCKYSYLLNHPDTRL